jgi:hypothetical protein
MRDAQKGGENIIRGLVPVDHSNGLYTECTERICILEPLVEKICVFLAQNNCGNTCPPVPTKKGVV